MEKDFDYMLKINNPKVYSYYPDQILKHEFYNLKFEHLGIKDEEDTKIIPLKNVLENISQNFSNLKTITFSFPDIERYKELLNTLEKVSLGTKILVEFSDKYSLNDIAEVASSKTKIIYPLIDYNNITTVDKKIEKNLDYFTLNPYVNLDPSLMKNEEFLEYIDDIVEAIEKYAKNDKQKVLLLDRYFKKNFKYDCKLVKENKKLSENKESPSYYAQSLFKRKKGVCASFTSLATVILNHPKLHVETTYQHGPNHAWNDIKINNEMYSYDFTYNTANKLFISDHMIRFITKFYKTLELIKTDKSQKIGDFLLDHFYGKFLGDSFVKKPQSIDKRYGSFNYKTKEYKELGFEQYKTMPRKELLQEYRNIENINIENKEGNIKR